ncbi:SidA/IucD/PvdA family monooxygenase [Photobacterium sp. WH24]|uniref:SidA/IucD/PvdA family monooxygenase n=1 Tax=Photobacterium sp. WH24 TaxID=2827237 RepID=UPI001C45A6C9|nr:SidA/IucD/PvdA family monooxygenase [Photobacterium sp. WH24]MBV7262654.1 SidA/IucD/PvdA family monooxygenase [Photobacterium sp. WH24]
MNRNEYDLIGIGFGPGNIALAISLEEKDLSSSMLFLESNTAPDWQPEMLLDGSDIQHNPLRDFVTPRNPVSPYGFLSYLKEEDRLFEYLNLGLEFPLRKDYARYVRWVARKFDKWVSYGEKVIGISRDSDNPIFWRIDTSLNRTLYAKSVSFAPGRTPYIPPVFAEKRLSRVAHFTRYTSSLSQWEHESEIKSIAIVGSSQSAIELVLDLSARFPDMQIHNILRSYSYQLKDVSPFTEEIYFPEFVNDFYNLPLDEQKNLTQTLWRSNYSSADHDVIHSLYAKMYENKIDGRERITIHNMSDIIDFEQNNNNVVLVTKSKFSGREKELVVDGVILATGFRNMGGGENQEYFHPLLSDIVQHFHLREDESLHVNRDYSLEPINAAPPFYLNGLCESTHGFGDAGSFSLLSLRSWNIAESIEKKLIK